MCSHSAEQCLAFRDVNPQAPVHFLVIPKLKIAQLSRSLPNHKELLGHLMFTAKEVAKKEGLDRGFRIVVNDGVDGCRLFVACSVRQSHYFSFEQANPFIIYIFTCLVEEHCLGLRAKRIASYFYPVAMPASV